MKTTSYYKHSLGKEAETAALTYLQKQGLQLVEKNYSGQFGEIDLIMKEKEIYVFVEVRLRNTKNFTHSLESITKQKQTRIRKTATVYLLEKELLNKVSCRFDVIGMTQENGQFSFDWIKNAFY